MKQKINGVFGKQNDIVISKGAVFIIPNSVKEISRLSDKESII